MPARQIDWLASTEECKSKQVTCHARGATEFAEECLIDYYC